MGHQAYTHKIITGRNDRFDTLRQEGGISGFPKQKESPYDCYIAGHSGVSISAALGMAEAMRLRGEEGFAIAVIGDGSFGSGIAYEGMNNAGRSGEKIIIVLNDNDMSISRNVGNVANYLAKMRTSKQYFELKDNAKSLLGEIPLVGRPVRSALSRSKKALRQMLYHTNLFEDFGLKYFGPVDGHDLESLRDVFERAKEYAQPCIVHVHTVKGMATVQPAKILAGFMGSVPLIFARANLWKGQSRVFLRSLERHFVKWPRPGEVSSDYRSDGRWHRLGGVPASICPNRPLL